MADNYELPLVRSVLHPTDFSEGSQAAFAHALAIALIRKTSLTLLHAGGDGRRSWQSFPSVRGTLERWGMLDAGSPRSAVFDQLAVRVKKVVSKEKNPVAASLDYLAKNPTDLIVLATRGRRGAPRWLKPSVAENVARGARAMTLFVPGRGRGFVAPVTGRLTLRRVVVPIAHSPDPRPAIQFATRISRVVGGDVQVALLHIGDSSDVPDVTLPDEPGVDWVPKIREGDVPGEIVAEADRSGANLIIMTTDGRDVLIDAVRGSHTERVIRRGSCPLLAVPVTWSNGFAPGDSISEVVAEEDRRQTRMLKREFRDAARELHPDRAQDEEDRTRRTNLMARANRAYKRQDVGALRRIREKPDEGD